MAKKCLAALLALTLVMAGPAVAAVDDALAAYEDYGKVLAAEESDGGVTIEAEGYYGYHMDEDPSMTVEVTIGADGIIQAAKVTGAKAQTAGFDAMITQEYMDAAYVGTAASPSMTVDAVSGATATSQAVRYAVETAANYALKAYGYAADTFAADKAELSEVYPATYETIESAYAPDAKKVGTVLYAARGVAADGTEVIAMKVKSALSFSFKGSAGTGWTAAEPSAFTMAIVVDAGTKQVCAWRVLVDGTKRSAQFAVPEDVIDRYEAVVIDSEDVFDAFTDGLVMALEFETESGEDGPLITGTSIVYTGKTEQGTFSSQLVRNCFRTAAMFFCNGV